MCASNEGDSPSTRDMRFDDLFEDESAHPSRAYNELACQLGNRHYSGSGSSSSSDSGGDQLGGHGIESKGTESRSDDDVNIEN